MGGTCVEVAAHGCLFGAFFFSDGQIDAPAVSLDVPRCALPGVAAPTPRHATRLLLLRRCVHVLTAAVCPPDPGPGPLALQPDPAQLEDRPVYLYCRAHLRPDAAPPPMEQLPAIQLARESQGTGARGLGCGSGRQNQWRGCSGGCSGCVDGGEARR